MTDKDPLATLQAEFVYELLESAGFPTERILNQPIEQCSRVTDVHSPGGFAIISVVTACDVQRISEPCRPPVMIAPCARWNQPTSLHPRRPKGPIAPAQLVAARQSDASKWLGLRFVIHIAFVNCFVMIGVDFLSAWGLRHVEQTASPLGEDVRKAVAGAEVIHFREAAACLPADGDVLKVYTAHLADHAGEELLH